MRSWAASCALALLLAGCATPYQEAGFSGGVSAVRIDETTLQVTARGNGLTSPETVQRYLIRKAAEATLAAGYDTFMLIDASDGTRRAYLVGDDFAARVDKPKLTALVAMRRGPKPADAPVGLFDAREVVRVASMAK